MDSMDQVQDYQESLHNILQEEILNQDNEMFATEAALADIDGAVGSSIAVSAIEDSPENEFSLWQKRMQLTEQSNTIHEIENMESAPTNVYVEGSLVNGTNEVTETEEEVEPLQTQQIPLAEIPEDVEMLTEPLIESVVDPIQEPEVATDPPPQAESDSFISEPIELAQNQTTQEGSKRKLEESLSENEGGSEDKDDGAANVPSADVSEGPAPAKKPLLEINVRKLLPDLQKLWKPVDDDPSDFTAWTYLLQYVDHENELLAARDAYDGFLARYPFCYGYWKKYADLEKRKGSAEDCYKVFKRGLQSIPLSVDLWIHYLNYVKATHDLDKEYIREQFRCALKAVGLEFRSDKLWEHYLQYEKESGDLPSLLAVYDLLLATPTQSYVQHFQNFKDFVNAHSPEEILKEEEYLDLKTAVEDVVNASSDPEEKAVLEQGAIREKIIEKRQEIHKKTEAEAQARWAYEEAIKRPYFHVKPLEKGQLKMWKEYLDFEIERGDEKRILILFARCLIACCLYEEYWIKYAKYLQGQKEKNVEKIREIFSRACNTHHAGKPWINLHWAAFEEAQDNISKASEILEKLDKVIPNSAHVHFRRINLERRQGNFDKCVELFEKYIADVKNKSTVAHMKIKFSRFIARFLNDYDRAVKVLQDAIEEDESIKAKAIMGLIDLGISKKPVDFQLVITSFDNALQSDLPNEQKVMFAHRKVEFLDDFGTDITSIHKAQEELETIASQLKEKKATSDPLRGEEETFVPKFSKPPNSGPSSYQSGTGGGYNHSGGGSSSGGGGHPGGPGGQDYGSQYGQYPNWNYQQQQQPSAGGYGGGYPQQHQQQNWNAYGGYHG